MLRKFLTALKRKAAPSHLSLVGGQRRAAKPPVVSMPLRTARGCRWQPQGQKNASFSTWRCATCGVEAYSRDGKAPGQCKKGLDGKL